MKTFDDKVAVITGAASGIGRALAVKLSRLGSHLALADLNLEGLSETAELARRGDRKITIHRLDVSQKEAVYRFADEVERGHGQTDLLINNAGVSTGFEFDMVELGYFESVMNINFWGVVYGCKAFLPMLRKRPEAHIANVSSVFAIGVPPRYAPYSAAKAAVRAFTEALAAEFMVDKSPIGVSCIFPGGVNSNIARTSEQHTTEYVERNKIDVSAFPEERLRQAEIRGEALKEYFKHRPMTSPEDAAECIVEGIRNNQARILVGNDAIEIDKAVRSDPENYLGKMIEYLGPEYF